MTWKWLVLLVPVVVMLGYLLTRPDSEESSLSLNNPKPFPVLDATEIASQPTTPGRMELATFGSGCFWCTEAVFLQLKGVSKVVSGYSGGDSPNPTYREVCTGTTGHAEVVQVTFDPAVISYPELLEVFWRSHDPTTKNRQGNDSGPQYRSVIFTHTEQQKKDAERYKAKIDEAGVFTRPLVTEIEPYREFYPAELKHQDFFARNPNQGYCQVIIAPKVEKLRKVFHNKLKDENH